MSSSKPIILWPRRQAAPTTDDVGNEVLKSMLPPAPPRAPYELDGDQEAIPEPRLSVPSLAFFCLKRLLDYPEQVRYRGTPPVPYDPAKGSRSRRVLQCLVNGEHRVGDIDLRTLDPRMWAVIVQSFSSLPSVFRTYSIPLSDPHLPLLQSISPYDDFSLVTVVDLAECRALTDETITQLAALHTLCALDVSRTSLTSNGIARLARTLIVAEEDHVVPRRGPWGLRILRMRRCRKVDDGVFTQLAPFRLLSFVDVRDTRCTSKGARTLTTFVPCGDARLEDGPSLIGALDVLASSVVKPPVAAIRGHAASLSTFYPTEQPYALSVATLQHVRTPAAKRKNLAVNKDNTCVVLPAASDGGNITASARVYARPVAPAFGDDRQRENAVERRANWEKQWQDLQERREAREREKEALSEERERPGLSDDDDMEGDQFGWDDFGDPADEVDYHLDRETRELEYRRPLLPPSSNLEANAAAMFYGNPKRKVKPAPPPPLALGLRKDTPPVILDTESADPLLLYRAPPPYSHLAESLAAESALSSEAPAKRKHESMQMKPDLAAAAKLIAPVMKMVNARRRTDTAVAPVQRVAPSSPANAFKNPFQRKTEPNSALPASLERRISACAMATWHASYTGPAVPAKGAPILPTAGPSRVASTILQPFSAPRAVLSATATANTLRAPQQPAKRLRPITSLPIPPRPESSEKPKPAESRTFGRTPSRGMKETDLREAFALGKPSAPPTSPKHLALKPPNSALAVKRQRSLSPARARKPAAKDKEKGAKMKPRHSFDWHGWSKPE